MGQTYQSILIEAPADEVWAAIRDFHDMSWTPNVVTDLKVVGDLNGDEVGAGRVLNDAFHETLRELDDDSYEFSYTIDDGPSPISKAEVSYYVGRVSVRPITEGSGSFVEWSSTWENNDAAAAEFCHGIYVALLTDMKRSLESR